jgi:hypothetical protein
MEYKKSKVLKTIRTQCEGGAKLAKSRSEAGISRTTLFYWCQRPLIKRYILECEKRSDERRDDGVEDGLMKKLINGNASGKEYEFYLTNRRPNKWKQEKSIITVNNTTQVNQVLKARDEILEGMSDEQRKQVISRIREALNKPSDN